MRKFLAIGIMGFIIASIGGLGWFFSQKNTVQTAKPSEAAQLAAIKKIQLVALGDSLTAGVGDNAKVQGYTGRIAKKVQQQYDIAVAMQNFGRAGDRSDQIQQRLTTQPEIQTAIHHANVIVMTVGGNDLQQLLLKNQAVQTTSALTMAVKAGQNTYQDKLTALFQTIRQYNSDAPIYIFGNYNPIFVHFPMRQDFNTDVGLFNQVNQQVARADKNSQYVDIFELTYGQYQAKQSREQLLTDAKSTHQTAETPDQIMQALTAKPTVLNNWLSTVDNYHPNSIGYDYMTKQLFHQIRRGQASWLTTH